MIPLETDLSIWKRLELEVPPVGVNFTFDKPDGIEHIDRPMGMCEWIKEAHHRDDAFYASMGDEDCMGDFILGMTDMPPYAHSGQIGKLLEIFQDARTNTKMYENLPTFPKGTVNHVICAPLDAIASEPDLLIVLAEPTQAEIILRAMTYNTGEKYEPKSQTVMACAYLFAYPYFSGKVNFILTGMSFGMKAREVFTPGKVLISIPYNWIPVITENLGKMKWVLPAYTMGRENYVNFFPHDELAEV
jgi:uncharacterized protein (DUF169 family)